jgi:hypothetical protein
MLRSTALFASAAFLLALAGCNDFEPLDTADGVRPVVNAMETPPLGHELHKMFETEKADATYTELPPQF